MFICAMVRIFSAVASLNGTFHLSPYENIFTIALINIHYLYNIHELVVGTQQLDSVAQLVRALAAPELYGNRFDSCQSGLYGCIFLLVKSNKCIKTGMLRVHESTNSNKLLPHRT
jgi:hypothetical protein